MRGDLDQMLSGVDTNVDGFGIIINEKAVFVDLALIPCRLQQAAVGEDHVVIKTMQGSLFALAAAAPPICRLFGEEALPTGCPEPIAEVGPLVRNPASLQNGQFIGPGLQGHPLVEDEAASAIEAAAQDDGVARAGGGDRLLQGHGLSQGGAAGASGGVGSDIEDPGRACRQGIVLPHGAVRPARGLGERCSRKVEGAPEKREHGGSAKPAGPSGLMGIRVSFHDQLLFRLISAG
ncbi:MAG: hypothetical protein BWY77_00671 [bacterium ADurb.Bin431]|nr:MAG: hypothetical protein BWY77_00671 [bacterium ADurb.Bin431]